MTPAETLALEQLRQRTREDPARYARMLLGEPTDRTGRELRYGSNGSLVIALTGEKAGTWYSFEDHTGGDMIDLVRRELRCPFKEAVTWLERAGGYAGAKIYRPVQPKQKPRRPVADDSIAFALEIYHHGVEPWGGPVETYLHARKLRLLSSITDIRFHARCPRGRDRLPAMVALMRDVVTNKPVGIHRTFLKPDGSGKADVTPAKMMLGRAAGAVVKLTPDDDVTLGIGLSEGIEDGLAILCSGWVPVWAALSAGSMKQFPVLNGIEALTLFSDADAPGRRAAEECAGRWRANGKAVAIVEPRACKDFAAMAEVMPDA